jgi:hypothetical protein
MPVKITNPNIIDLAAWQEVVNEINTVSDKVDSIVTTYGTGSPNDSDWTRGATREHEFNLGSQRIVSGRYRFVSADEEYDADTKAFYGPIAFGTAFAAEPIITATIEFGNPDLPINPANRGAALVIYNGSSSGFHYKLINSGSTTKLGGSFYINWMAIGPR